MKSEDQLKRNVQVIAKRFDNDLEAFLIETVAMFGEAPPESVEEQHNRLARFIMDEVPGEPSESQGVVDTAIRLIRDGQNYRRSGLCVWCQIVFKESDYSSISEGRIALVNHAKNCSKHPAVIERDYLRAEVIMLRNLARYESDLRRNALATQLAKPV